MNPSAAILFWRHVSNWLPYSACPSGSASSGYPFSRQRPLSARRYPGTLSAQQTQTDTDPDRQGTSDLVPDRSSFRKSGLWSKRTGRKLPTTSVPAQNAIARPWFRNIRKIPFPEDFPFHRPESGDIFPAVNIRSTYRAIRSISRLTSEPSARFRSVVTSTVCGIRLIEKRHPVSVS